MTPHSYVFRMQTLAPLCLAIWLVVSLGQPNDYASCIGSAGHNFQTTIGDYCLWYHDAQVRKCALLMGFELTTVSA